jgi:exosortase D (VPLPA-CTERM-specific)
MVLAICSQPVKIVMSTLSVKKPHVVLSPAIILAIAAALVSIAVFGPGALLELVRRWNGQEEYSHGFLIPIITAWLLWTRRHSLRASVGQPSFAGVALILLALGMHLVGELSAIWILSQIGFVITLMGIVLAIGGYSLLRVAFIPLAYLLFAIPLPYFIDAALTLKLQLISSELGVLVIRLFQIPVYLDGNLIDMGTYKLQVVEACSGLRYLYPLLSLSFLAAYLFHGKLWQRALIFLSGIPIAIGMNGFRIGLVGVLVDRWGTQMAEGFLHFFEGWVIFLACSALLAGEMYVLARLSGRRFFDVFHVSTTQPHVDPGQRKLYRPVPSAAALGLLCLGFLAVFFVSGRSEVIPERTRFVAFPTRLEQWQGHTTPLDLATEQFLNTDDYIMADYSGPDGRPVNFYVAYYASQRKNESPHSPIVCLPGGGWLITQLERRNFDNGAASGSQPFNRVIIQKGSNRDLAYYWFEERGRMVADEYWAKWYLLSDSIVKNRTDGALVRLVTQIKPDESDEDADRRLQSFMRAALPRLTEFLPSSRARSVNSALLRPENHGT